MNRTDLNHCNLNHLFVFLGALGLSACDLPMKDIGNESDGSQDTDGTSDTDEPSDTDPSAGTVADDGDPACDPGDTKLDDDGCNTCHCTDEGLWACTKLGCVDTDGPDDDECEPGDTMPADDGCNTCHCDNDGHWACTEIDCGPGDGVMLCDDEAPMDPLSIDSAAVQGNDLVLEVSYSGGCAEHVFGACWDGMFLESFPVQIGLAISHDDNDDHCDALGSEQITFDLSPLAEAYADAYGPGNATIVINLDGWAGGLEYTF
jgi:hypothetical protein